MNLEEIGISVGNWFDSAQDRDYWRALVNAALHLPVQLIIWKCHRSGLGRRRYTFKIVAGKCTLKRPSGKPRHRWEDNIRLDHKDISINTRNWVDSTKVGIIVEPLLMRH